MLSCNGRQEPNSATQFRCSKKINLINRHESQADSQAVKENNSTKVSGKREVQGTDSRQVCIFNVRFGYDSQTTFNERKIPTLSSTLHKLLINITILLNYIDPIHTKSNLQRRCPGNIYVSLSPTHLQAHKLLLGG